MLKQWSGVVKWSILSLLFAISMKYDCRHPCHITHWSHIGSQCSDSGLEWSNGISMIYDCMNPCHITHWSKILKWGRPSQIVPPKMHGHRALHLQVLTFLEWSMSSLFFIISMICDCMHGTLFTSHIGPQCSSSGLEWSIITALRHLYDMWLILSHHTFVPNAQAVVWNGQMVNIVTALHHLHDI